MNTNNFYELDLPENERWENLTIANDFMFGKIFQNPELCLGLLRLILPDLNITDISFPVLQKSIRETLDTKGIRPDITVDEKEQRIISVDMQVSNADDIRKRTKAYHSLLTVDSFQRKNVGKYGDIPESIVIFICCFDLFRLKRHIYTFRNTCVQNPDLSLNDGTTTIFLNSKGKDDDISPELKAFLNLVNGKTSGDPFVRRIEQELFVARQNAQWRHDYMLGLFEKNANIAKGRAEGRAEGIVIGREEGRFSANLETAKRMLIAGMDIMQIQAFTGLSLDVIRNL